MAVRTLQCKRGHTINLSTVLRCGQTFRWSYYDAARTSTDDWLVGVMRDVVWKLRQPCKNEIEFEVLGEFKKSPKDIDHSRILRHYLALDIVDLEFLYDDWKQKDKHFVDVLASCPDGRFDGIRILQQPPFECLISFICSQNNNIKRITGMINSICESFGDKVTATDGRDYHNFPRPTQLCVDGAEARFRALSCGYRAKYLARVATQITNKGGEAFLETLHCRNVEKRDATKARSELLKLNGVGPKVADCVLLMSLGYHKVVPVDTHVFQITQKFYIKSLRLVKSITPTVYKQISTFYGDKFGLLAGWAQSILFSSDLSLFANQTALPIERQVKMANDTKRKQHVTRDLRKYAGIRSETVIGRNSALVDQLEAGVTERKKAHFV